MGRKGGSKERDRFLRDFIFRVGYDVHKLDETEVMNSTTLGNFAEVRHRAKALDRANFEHP